MPLSFLARECKSSSPSALKTYEVRGKANERVRVFRDPLFLVKNEIGCLNSQPIK